MSIDAKLSEHSDEQIKAAYLDGWADGRAAAKEAARAGGAGVAK